MTKNKIHNAWGTNETFRLADCVSRKVMWVGDVVGFWVRAIIHMFFWLLLWAMVSESPNAPDVHPVVVLITFCTYIYVWRRMRQWKRQCNHKGQPYTVENHGDDKCNSQ